MSQLVFNGYAHAENEVGIKIDHRILEDKFRKPFILVSRWTIAGALLSDGTPGALAPGIAALDAAYRDGGSNYGDATFTANGHTHTLSDSASFSGVRVAAFGYMSGPWKMRTELSNRRAFYAVLQAEYRFGSEVVAFREEVQRIGDGGPKWRYMPSLIGLPVQQQLQSFTSVKYVQRGVLVLRSSKPPAGIPYFSSNIIHGEQTRITEIAPTSITKNGGGQIEEMHGVEWVYVAESQQQLGSQVNFIIPTI